ncbi:hypothetical protein PoB_005931000 [Plakobranchus ocellatus]|uniref:Uncharacterized protein n=1 Tax=Plakobranchus ocellatus TaxID=259542 RepID=A0AAV4CLY4_9GAST|nr:hypothetical protein PoB_005931000 [Plakobranchus ocellatus]
MSELSQSACGHFLPLTNTTSVRAKHKQSQSGLVFYFRQTCWLEALRGGGAAWKLGYQRSEVHSIDQAYTHVHRVLTEKHAATAAPAAAAAATVVVYGKWRCSSTR